MKKQIIKRFTQFVNENHMDNMNDMDHETGQMLSHADGTEETDMVTADALGCSPEELDNYYIGSPVSRYDEPDFMDDFAPVMDLFYSDEENDGMGFELKKKGQIIWTVRDAGPGGYAQAHLFNHNGMKVVVVEGDDGPFVYIKPSVNEGDNPAHNLIRTAHNRAIGKHTGPFDPISDWSKMTDDEKDRFDKVADRTKNFRKADISRNEASIIAGFYRNNPNRLLMILENDFYTVGSEVAADIVDQFVNDPTMTIDQLAQEVSSSATHRKPSPEWVIKLLTRYAHPNNVRF